MFTQIIITSVVFLILAFLLYMITVFNSLKAVKNNVIKAEANIKVLLKQRFDEIPQLVEVCKKYMDYETSVLKDLTNLRSDFEEKINKKEELQVEEIESFDEELSNQIGNLKATAENYPNLKTSEQFLNLQIRISSIEEQIADRREFFNESVNAYNINIESFPDMIISSILGYRKKDMLDISEKEKEIPKNF